MAKLHLLSSAATVVCLLTTMMSMLLLPSSAQSSCEDFTFTNRNFDLCRSLTRLGSSLHWTYDPTLATAAIAYRAPRPAAGWAAWGLNLAGTGMIGTQAIVAVRSSNGSTSVFTTPISDRNPTMVQTPVSFQVANLAAEYAGGVLSFFATISLPNNKTKFNHAWQESTTVSDAGVPGPHPTTGDNDRSYGTIDFLSGNGSVSSDDNSALHRENIHGVLNAVSWGILMPVGAVIARYLRVFKSADPAWFYLHITCQCSAYIVGVSGWGLGLKLGGDEDSETHRNIGISLFCLATLQVFALFLRPHKEHKLRIFWNAYHHSVGYMVIILSVVNVYKGFDLLEPAKKWKEAYTGIIVSLAIVAVLLEVWTWIVVLRHRREKKTSEVKEAQQQQQA